MNIYLCKGDPPCTCKASHRGKICEEMVRVRNEDGSYKMIQEKGKEYYYGHEKDSDDPKERWVHELIQCGNKGKFRMDCNGIFEHRQVLCEEHYPEHKEWNDKRCGVCGSPHRSCCC